MADARDEWVQDEDGTLFLWPFCKIAGCPNRICLAKGETRFCWPHSDSGQSVDEIIAEADPRPPVAVLSFGFSEWDGATQCPAALPPEVKAP